MALQRYQRYAVSLGNSVGICGAAAREPTRRGETGKNMEKWGC